MLIRIKYKAKLTYTWQGKYHENELCNITHEIDTETLQTTNFNFEPIEEIQMPQPNRIELDSQRLTFCAPAESYTYTAPATRSVEDLEDYIFRFFEYDTRIQIEDLNVSN